MNDRSNAKPMLIGGEWIADSEEAIVSVNPANGQVNYEICAATPRHVAPVGGLNRAPCTVAIVRASQSGRRSAAARPPAAIAAPRSATRFI